jgi:hypothetical protein
MTTNVLVFHRGNDLDLFDLVAVHTKLDTAFSPDVALERAYRWTQNIEGSWSRDDIERNGDRNPDVLVCAPLPTHNGEVLGLRSSMSGDRFYHRALYRCAAFGFEPIPDTDVATYHVAGQPVTLEQAKALVGVYLRDPMRMSFAAWVEKLRPEFGGGGAYMIEWAGMWLGVEPDGYTHS